MKSGFKPNREITPCQFIVEQICKNGAAKAGEDLPFEFWKNKDKWGKFFMLQCVRCQQLLKKYSEQAILRIVTTKKLYSIFPKWIEEEIKKEQNKINLMQNNIKQPEIVNDVFCSGYSNKTTDLNFLD